MTLAEAFEQLETGITDDGLSDGCWYRRYAKGDGSAVLDGTFSADDLEAIAVYMRATQNWDIT